MYIYTCKYVYTYVYTCVYMWDAIFRNKFPPYQTEAENKIRITVKMSACVASINFPSILSSFHHLPRQYLRTKLNEEKRTSFTIHYFNSDYAGERPQRE